VGAAADPAASDDVVRAAARAHERDRYLAALLGPRARRADLVALAAFAGEIGRIPLYVSEPMMGRIRLQWWRERLEQGNSGSHPVAAAIIEVARRHDLPLPLLYGLIDAHEDSLGDRPFPDQAALLAHVDRVDGALFDLAGVINGSPPDAALTRDAGRGYGLARIALETPAALAQGRLLLPAIGPVDTSPDGWRQILPQLRAVAAVSRAHCAASSAALQQLPRKARTPFLPLALVEPYLRALEQFEYRPGALLDVNPLKRVWNLLRCHLTGRV
jgi:phytoene synthase